MRFKQALSRKLAAALSAVMILSTIAPTSVPVLAAAPDDVLVDSNVEYDLQDAGSEDVLLDSAESSLAEETDTLEVAGEELLSNEAASDEVLVDSAEEVLSEETGIEPVDGGVVVEAPEGDGQKKMSITFVSGNVIKDVEYKLLKEGADVVTGLKFDSASGNTINILSSNDVDEIQFTGITSTGEYEANEFKAVVSINGGAAETPETSDLDNFITAGPLDAAFPLDGSMYIKAEPTVFDGSINLEVLSGDIIKKVQILSSNKTGDNIPWTDAEEDTFKNKVINFTRAKDFTFEIVDSDGYRIDDSVLPTTAYTLSFNGTGIDKKLYTLDGTEKITLAKDKTNITARFEAKPIDKYNKKGILRIKVMSQNTINGKVVSINTIKAQLGDYAIEQNASGEFIEATYRTGVSECNISDASKGWKKDGDYTVIDMPYEYAENAKIVVAADDGNNTNHSRYYYSIGGKDPIPLDTDVDYGQEITLGNSDVTEVVIKPVQVSFDPEIKIHTVSGGDLGGIINGFNIIGFDKNGSSTSYPVDATSNSTEKKVTFKDAKKIVFDYDEFALYGDPTSIYPGSWVYRIEYGDVKKSLYNATGHKVLEIEADKDGNFPAEITVSAVPNVKITLSANGTEDFKRAKNDVFSEFAWQDENERTGTAVASDGFAHFYAEPGKVVSINSFTSIKPYVFPYVKGATPAGEGEDSLTGFTLPVTTSDTVYEVAVKEFNLENKSVMALVNGTRNDDGKAGEAVISINGFTANNAVAIDIEPSELSGNKVFAADSDPLTFTIKMDSTDNYQYTFDEVWYTYYDSDLNPVKEVLKADNGDITNTSDGKGNYTVEIAVDNEKARRTFLKDGALKFTVVEHKNTQMSSFSLVANPANTIKLASATVDGEYKFAINKDGYYASGSLPYGKVVNLKAESIVGYKLVSVNIVCTNSANSINITDSSKLALFAGKGYDYTLTKGTTVTFNTEPDYAIDVRYKIGSDALVPKNGKYSVNHLRPVSVQYKSGTGTPSGTKVEILIGSKTVSDNAGITKSGDVYYVDGTKGDLAGQNVTFKFYTGDGSKTDASLRTVILALDKANTGVKFKEDSYKQVLGTTVTYTATVNGNFEAIAKISDNSVARKNEFIEFKNKGFEFKSDRDSAKGDYIVNIIDKYDNTLVYATVKITLETDTVKAAAAPTVKMIGTTNRGVTLSLKANKINTKIDGLYYEVKVITKKQTKSYFKETVTEYVPISETSKFIDLFKNPTGPEKYAGDPEAEFVAVARIVQLKTDKSVVIAADKWSEEKDCAFKTKEGEKYETKLKLKKETKGNAFTNMDAPNAYRIGVVYSKDTAVQEIYKAELLDKKGNVLGGHAGSVSIENNYLITFTPSTTGVPAGDYQIRAYALEPDSVDVTATIKIKVVQAISGLTIKNAPVKVYKQAGKAVSFKLEAIDTDTNQTAKKVVYEIVDPVNTSGLISVAKNGKVTIKKNLVVDNTSFKVKATANDYQRVKGTEVTDTTYTISVKTTPDSELSLAYAKYDDSFAIGNLSRLESSYYSDELCGDSTTDYELVTYVTAFDRETIAGGSKHYVPATYKVGGSAKLLGVYKGTDTDADGVAVTYAKIGITKLGKPFKITVNATDGSGRNKKNIPVTVENAKGKLGVQISSAGNVQAAKYGEKTISFNNYAPEKSHVWIKVDGQYTKNGVTSEAAANIKISAKNAKVTKETKNGFLWYMVYPTDTTSTLKITDVESKTDYNVTLNNLAVGAKAKKAKVSKATNKLYHASKGTVDGKGKIYSHLDFSDTTGFTAYETVSWNKVTYTVDGATKDQYVMIDVPSVYKKIDGTSRDVATPIRNIIKDAKTAEVGTGNYILKLTGTSFTVDYIGADKKFEVNPGSYTINITPVSLKAGKYIADAKTVAYKVVAVKAPNANVKPKTAVKFATSEGTIDPGSYKNFIKSPTYKATGIQFTELKDVNVKGKMNKFHTNFSLTDAEKGKLEYVGADAISVKAKDAKDKLQGWVTYKYQCVDGTVVPATIKVTIKPTGDTIKKK